MGELEAEGRLPVVYTFVLPSDITVHSARFVADVAGDYRLGVSQTHDMFNIGRRGAEVTEMAWPAERGRASEMRRGVRSNGTEEDEEIYYTVDRSDGSNSTSSNRRMVSFDYGLPTGQSLASINAQAELVGLELSGEFAHNMQDFIFPVGNNEGERSSARAWAQVA